MRFLMIYPDIDTVSGGMFHEGIGRLSSYVKQRGHDFRLLHYTRLPDRPEITESVRAAGADLVGFSVATPQYGYAREILKGVRDAYSGPVIFGGIHPTLQPDEVLSHGDVDMVCIGEGEETVGELCDAIKRGADVSGIRSLWVRKGDAILRNPVRPLVEDLDILPDPDRTLFAGVPGFFHICAVTASRGCPYSCTYCCNHIQRDLYPNKKRYVRFLSVERIIRQIEDARRLNPGIVFLNFNDDILNLRMDWFRKFVHEYKTRVALPFECNTRPTLLDEETADLLDEAGCMRLRIGLESGNDRIRTSVLGRQMPQEDLLQAAERVHARGIQLQTYNMVGLPGERMSEMLDTVELNARMRTTVMQASIFFPFPRTELYKTCAEKGLLSARPAGDFFRDCQLNLPRRARSQVLFVHRYCGALRNVFLFLWALPAPLRIPARAAFRAGVSCPIFPAGFLARLYEKQWAHRLFRVAHGYYWRLYRKGLLARREKNMSEKERGRVFRTAHDYAAELGEQVKRVMALFEKGQQENRALQQQVEERSHWAQDLVKRVEEGQKEKVALQQQVEERTRWAQELDKRVTELSARVVALQEEVQTKNAWALGLDKEVNELRALLHKPPGPAA